jgi:hypothetical protein
MDAKQFRLFQLFEAGLSSFVGAQQQPGVMDDEYLLQLVDKKTNVNMYIPLAFIIGDVQGGDGIFGHAVVYNEEDYCAVSQQCIL